MWLNCGWNNETMTTIAVKDINLSSWQKNNRKKKFKKGQPEKKILKRITWKKLGLNRLRTHDLCDTGAAL